MRLKDERFGLTCQLSLMRFFSGAPQLGMMGLPGTWGSVWNILGGPNRGGAAGIRGGKARAAARLPAVPRTAPYGECSPVQDVNTARLRNPELNKPRAGPDWWLTLRSLEVIQSPAFTSSELDELPTSRWAGASSEPRFAHLQNGGQPSGCKAQRG